MEVRILPISYIHDLWGYFEHSRGIHHQKQSSRNPRNIAIYLPLRFHSLIPLLKQIEGRYSLHVKAVLTS